MKQFSTRLLALCLLFIAERSFGQERRFGLGVIIGEPTGLSAKLWTSSITAFDFGLGWSVVGDRSSRYDGSYNGGSRVHFHMDYLWHAFDAISSTDRIPLYYGIGGRVDTGAGYNSSTAVRGVIGLAWLPRGSPIDYFVEVAPLLRLTSSSGFAVDAGFGARYFFN